VGHYYELKGLVYCESCGLKMTTYTADGYRYYVCEKRRKFQSCDGPVRSAETTTTRKRSIGLEDEVSEYIQDLIANPDKLRAQLDAAIAVESVRNPDKDVTSWLRVVDDCDKKCAKYQEMYASDLMTIDELSDKLRELDKTKATAEEHPANACAGQSRIEELRATKKAMLEAYTAGIAYDGIIQLSARDAPRDLRGTAAESDDGEGWQATDVGCSGRSGNQVNPCRRGLRKRGRAVPRKLRVGGELSSSKGTVTVMAEVAG
jgi:hypothetical protein